MGGMFAELETPRRVGKITIKEGICPVNLTERNKSSKKVNELLCLCANKKISTKTVQSSPVNHQKLNLSHNSTTKRVCWWSGHFLAVLDKYIEEHLILVNCTGLPWPLEKKVLKAGYGVGCQTNLMY